MTNAQQMHRAMLDLQTRKITPDEFRATMRALKAQATALHTVNPNAR
jgi:hypothetical protein